MNKGQHFLRRKLGVRSGFKGYSLLSTNEILDMKLPEQLFDPNQPEEILHFCRRFSVTILQFKFDFMKCLRRLRVGQALIEAQSLMNVWCVVFWNDGRKWKFDFGIKVVLNNLTFDLADRFIEHFHEKFIADRRDLSGLGFSKHVPSSAQL